MTPLCLHMEYMCGIIMHLYYTYITRLCLHMEYMCGIIMHLYYTYSSLHVLAIHMYQMSETCVVQVLYICMTGV